MSLRAVSLNHAPRGADRTRTGVPCFTARTCTITAPFGNRLAGLADGEAHFNIARLRHKPRGRGIYTRPINDCYACSFQIKLRADDRPLLERCFEETGLGTLTLVHNRSEKDRASRNPAVLWRVSKQIECLAIVAIFEEFPLWSKKARDFEIWAQAVRYWTADGVWRGWDPMARWFEEIREVRRYAG